MKRLLSKILSFYPVIIIVLTAAIIGLLNYKSGTTLTGWDNLHPEFYPSMNLNRSIFAVWQEYQSLGLLGGMGHAADLVRQLFIAILGLLIHENFLRYLSTILMYGLGGIGAYLLAGYVDSKKDENKIIHLTVALFYMLNLATLQMFYAPFEAFVAHFASLPFVLYAGLRYVKDSSKKSLLIAFLVFLLTTPQAYIPTLFVASLIALGIVLTTTLILSNKKKHVLGRIAKLTGIIFITNAFWLLPFAYFTLTSADVNVNSKINQMATESIYLQNKEFGNITDVALLKGFWFNNVDVDMEGNFTFMLEPWRQYSENMGIEILGYLLFALILTGVIATFIKKDKKLIPFAILFIFAFTMLATATPPFEQLNIVFRKVPLFGQAFRFPFTKFSLLTGLMFSLFLGVGLKTLIDLAKKKLHSKAKYLLSALVIGVIIITALPVFQGKLFYSKEQLVLPQEYQDTFDFFRNEDPNTRIANLPQHTFWGWNFYDWGYGGSGFLWYGIKQPIVDRAFDVWSTNSENYYYEIAQAIYKQDENLLRNVLNKYQINWVLFDKNIIYPAAPGSLRYEETQKLLTKANFLTPVRTFGDITIYKVALDAKPKNFLYSASNLPNINEYNWGEEDIPLNFTDNYLTDKGKDYDYYFPFRTLHSNRLQKDLEYKMTKNGDTITLTAQIPPSTTNRKLFIPEFGIQEESIPTRIQKIERANGTVEVVAIPQQPVIKIGNTQNVTSVTEIPLFTLSKNMDVKVNINGLADIELAKDSDSLITELSQKENNIITATAGNETLSSEITPEELTNLQSAVHIDLPKEASTLEVKIKAPNDNYYNFTLDTHALEVTNCDNYRNGKYIPTVLNGKLNLKSKNATACTTVFSGNLPHSTGYAVFLEAENKHGQPLHFWFLDNNSSTAPIDTYLPKSNETTLSTFVIPPQEEFGKGYSLHFDNISIGNEKVENTLTSGEITPLPYNFLKEIVVIGDNASPGTYPTTTINSTHPNESLYTATVKSKDSTYLVLAQSYDTGWAAYKVASLGWKEKIAPFFFGKKQTSHTKVNNWANAWFLGSNVSNSNSTLNNTYVIVFLPQYLEYAGLTLLVGFTITLIIYCLRKK